MKSWGVSFVAILKHIAVKNSNYGQMQQYLLFQHERDAGKPILDDEGRLVPRDGILIDGINCEPFSFPTECMELNRQWGKNSGFGEIKAHHYIVSFDPRDVPDHGLTPEKAQAIGMEFANRFFAGHQALVVTHTDGHNHTGNLHCHIVLNSLRKFTVPWDDFMERPIDAQAGYKHHPTVKSIQYMLHALNAICEREHLYTLDLSLPANTRITDREYHQQMREQEKLDMKNADMLADGLSPRNLRYANTKEKIRSAIDSAVGRAKTEQEFLSIMKESGINVRSRRGVYTFELPGRKRGVRGRSLGYAYEREAILERIAGKFVNREAVPPEYAALPRIFLIHSDLRLVVDLQNCVKAQQSRAYARKVQISNLQEMARTVAFIQEQGIDTLDALNANYEATQARYRAASAALQETGAQLAEVNEQIHHMGVYLSGKKTYQAFLHAKDKAAFRATHSGEISDYEKAARFLKETFEDAAFPSMKTLKAQKAALCKQKSRQKEMLRQSREEHRHIEIVRTNVGKILEPAQIRSGRSALSL